MSPTSMVTRSLDDVLSAPAKRGASQRAVARAAAARAALVDAKADGALSFACKAIEAAESATWTTQKC